jgi:hypothetical protein
VAPEATVDARRVVREPGPVEVPKPRLLDRVRLAIVEPDWERQLLVVVTAYPAWE